MTEHLRHRLPISEGVITFRIEQSENGSLTASIHRELGNHTPVSGGYYNRYRHRYHQNTLPGLNQTLPPREGSLKCFTIITSTSTLYQVWTKRYHQETKCGIIFLPRQQSSTNVFHIPLYRERLEIVARMFFVNLFLVERRVTPDHIIFTCQSFHVNSLGDDQQWSDLRTWYRTEPRPTPLPSLRPNRRRRRRAVLRGGRHTHLRLFHPHDDRLVHT